MEIKTTRKTLWMEERLLHYLKKRLSQGNRTLEDIEILGIVDSALRRPAFSLEECMRELSSRSFV